MSQLSSLELLAMILPKQQLEALSKQSPQKARKTTVSSQEVASFSDLKKRRLQRFGRLSKQDIEVVNPYDLYSNKLLDTRSTSPKSKYSAGKTDRQVGSPNKDQYRKLNQRVDELSEMLEKISITQSQRLSSKKKRERTNSQVEMSPPKMTSLRDVVTKVSQNQKLHPSKRNPYVPQPSIYYVSEVLKTYKDPSSIVRIHLQSSLHALNTLTDIKRPQQPHRKLNLTFKDPKTSKKSVYIDFKTLVLDLDETLIHCSDQKTNKYDAKLKIILPTGRGVDAFINVRPHAKEVLQSLSKVYEIFVFTASHSCYADPVIDLLDPDGRYITHRLYREHCSYVAGAHVKDLRILNRDLSKVILVDNAAQSFAWQIDNGIPIIPYFRGHEDFQLKSLQHYLQKLLAVQDVRKMNQKTFKMGRYTQYSNINDLVKGLYK